MFTTNVSGMWKDVCQRLRWRTASARVLPDFVILGGMKCGTTTLYETLVQHPRIVRAQHKETHYFDQNCVHGLWCYRAVFPLAPYMLAQKLIRGGPVLTGEATPYYLFHPHVPGRLHAVLPHAKLIVLLRDPVERAYSHYRHNLVRQLEPLSFEQALAAEDERLRADRQRIERNEPLSRNHRNFSYVARGIYADQLAAYFDLFPRSQALVLKSEDYFANPAQVLPRLLEFLGLGHDLPATMTMPDSARPRPAPMPAAARLRDFFAPHNERLSKCLGVDFGWDRHKACA
ncbi:MAG: sulfotransferase domain-containing protein [Gemmataceae bacterium]|nr:sulfotransferase domain-containing protein [Gemmataceae bacterium]